MTVVIADNQERDRAWIKELIVKNLSQVLPLHEAENGGDAVKLTLAHKPSLVFLDIDMPVLSGIRAAEEIIKELPDTGIIILSNHADEVWVRKIWKIMPSSGSFAYLLKDATDQQVVEAAQAVLNGDCSIFPRVQKILRRTESGPDSLTDSEFEVLASIAAGLTDKAIARRLFVTEKAIQARLKSVYSKLGCSSIQGQEDEFNHRCRAINIAVRRGLVNKTELDDWELAFVPFKS